jgi:ferredoxin
MTVRLSVSEACVGYGRCYSLAPDLLSSDDEGYVTIKEGSIELPDDQRELAEELADTCPEAAISVT